MYGSLELSSERTRVVKTGATAGVATFTVGFEAPSSFYVRAPELRTREIDRLGNVANELRNSFGWRWRYKIVHKVYDTHHGTVLANAEGTAKVELKGGPEDIAAHLSGLPGGHLNVHATDSVTLRSVGHRGTLAVGLVKLRWWGGVGPTFESTGGEEDTVVVEEVDPSATDDLGGSGDVG